jgi:UDP-N-acetylmuramyl-tripeptide synthetase
MTLAIKSAHYSALPLALLPDAVSSLAHAGEFLAGIAVRHITIDSREVQPGSLFVAVRGYCTDGHRFISSAVERGAVAVICEEFPAVMAPSSLYIKVADSRRALAGVARIFYGKAADQLQIIGVTGTNGKTTTARLITSMLNANGIPAGYIGTNLCLTGDSSVPLDRTTPEAHELHALFALMVEAGCRAVVMEVSSHALVLQRVHGLRFHAAIFTNLTMEHLDFHTTMDEYASAKRQLFDQLAPDGFAVFNSDDAFAAQMASRVAPEKIYYCTLQGGSPAPEQCRHRFDADILESTLASSMVALHFPERVLTMKAGLPGSFNVMNVLEAAAVGIGMELSPEEICHSLSAISAVDGRMERVSDGSQGYSVFVDYAHTPDALFKVLETLRHLKPAASRLLLVFGCGGNRDRAKRPEMGRIASEAADVVILTSDNPRYEDPEMILDEIERGIRGGHYMRISDRAEAIARAVAMLREGDVLLVAGKGHERYQEIAGQKYPFSDHEHLINTMRKKGAGYSAKESLCH